MSEKTIFGKILDGEIPADVVFENENLLAFNDIEPRAPIHVLIIPKKTAYRDVTELAEAEPDLLAEMVQTAKKLANELSNGDFRLVFNNGATSGQTVFHVHAHVLMGELGEDSI